MKEKIREILIKIEQEYKIKILFAIENGSRAWGMASQDSDYDVRFVYYHAVTNYISLTPKNEVINLAFDKDLKPCDAQDSLVDMCGFDIFKYLKLLFSSNPTAIEWLNSPIVYYGDNNLPLRKYMKKSFNQERLFKHYFSMFRNNYFEYIQQGKSITYKRYLYSIRGLLNAIYVYEFNEIPPLCLMKTIKSIKNNIPIEVYNKVQDIIEIKTQGLECDIIPRIPVFDTYFNIELQKEYGNFNLRKPDIKVFNEFVQDTVLFD